MGRAQLEGGRRKRVLISLTSLNDDANVLIGYSAITLDLTAHRKLEMCLTEREESKPILQAAHAGMW